MYRFEHHRISGIQDAFWSNEDINALFVDGEISFTVQCSIEDETATTIEGPTAR